MSKRQADIAEASLIKLNRPFVLPGTLEAHPVRAAGQVVGMSLRLQLRNDGNSPAVEVLFYVNFVVLNGEMPQDFDFSDRASADSRESEKIQIAARSHTFTGVLPVKFETIRDIWAGKHRLYLWGWITYKDIFGLRGKPFRTQFCWEIEIHGDEPTPTSGELEFRGMTHRCGYNCLDEKCV